MAAVSRNRARLVDIARFSLAGVAARPGRAGLTILGISLGTAALVATVGIAQTAGSQIVGRFDEFAATFVTVQPVRADVEGIPGAEIAIALDSPRRVSQINGVEASSTLTELETSIGGVQSIAAEYEPLSVGLFAASPALLETVGGTVVQGRTFDLVQDRRGDAVALVGVVAAEQLGINTLEALPTIRLNDQPFLVIGIFTEVEREPRLLDGVVIPNGTAEQLFGLRAVELLYARTAVGAAQTVGDQIAVAVNPGAPDLLKVSVPPEPVRIRRGIASDINTLFLLLGALSLVIGAVGVANITLVSVLERVSEIGVRRAIGARRIDIALQFLGESTILGLLGGLVGASAGVVTIAVVALARDWTPVHDVRIALATPVVGALIGILAGLYPAAKAANLLPVTALKSQG